MARKKDQSRKGGRRKIGRNKAKAERYEREDRREKNKTRRAKRIQRGFRRDGSSENTA